MTHPGSQTPGKQTGQAAGGKSRTMLDCIEECQTCHTVCLETVQYCLQKGGEHAKPEHVRLLLDCVDICQTSADFMIRGSPLHGSTCGVCAEACDACAKSCEAFGNDAQMKKCAEACRHCADSCRQMSAA